MAERRHSFSVKASRDQRLSLVVFVCVCSTSLLIWPETDVVFWRVLKLVFAVLILGFLGYQLWRLRAWHCRFELNGKGEGWLSTGETFHVLPRTWVTPFACLVYYQSADKLYLLPLWADMFSDTDYRHLCRLLLKVKTQAASQRESL
ncbi:protein YgfX [Shewanella seohaensis]|uniref:protein YgfX n=1 Tax=Shewanella seohaensis TaxID=755175 RepID=UPI0035B9D152